VAQASREALRFDGRVAIVTGAGGRKPSLGEAHARYLAARGAKVVVNDLGIGPDGTGALPANAQTIVDEINAAGGEAVGDTHSVAEPESAEAVVQTALDTWGQVDILVNNAGVVFFAPFEEISTADLRRIHDSHLYGSLWMARAAFPHMKKAGYGRIVNICSDAMHGYPYLTVYGTAKAGAVGLTRGLALEGANSGIKVNALAPWAETSKHANMKGVDPSAEPDPQNQDVPPPTTAPTGSVEQVAPVVAYLCHELCEPNGSVLWAGDGLVREFRYYTSAGYRNDKLEIEDVHANIAQVLDQTGAQPVELMSPEALERVQRKPYVPRN